jgi:hypothetical protein
MSWQRLTHLLAGRRSKFVVLALWLVLAAGVAPLAVKLTEVQDNDDIGPRIWWPGRPVREEPQATSVSPVEVTT